MDRGAWRSTVHGVCKESDTTERLTHSNQAASGQQWHLVSAKETAWLTTFILSPVAGQAGKSHLTQAASWVQIHSTCACVEEELKEHQLRRKCFFITESNSARRWTKHTDTFAASVCIISANVSGPHPKFHHSLGGQAVPKDRLYNLITAKVKKQKRVTQERDHAWFNVTEQTTSTPDSSDSAVTWSKRGGVFTRGSPRQRARRPGSEDPRLM